MKPGQTARRAVRAPSNKIGAGGMERLFRRPRLLRFGETVDVKVIGEERNTPPARFAREIRAVRRSVSPASPIRLARRDGRREALVPRQTVLAGLGC